MIEKIYLIKNSNFLGVVSEIKILIHIVVFREWSLNSYNKLCAHTEIINYVHIYMHIQIHTHIYKLILVWPEFVMGHIILSHLLYGYFFQGAFNSFFKLFILLCNQSVICFLHILYRT